MKLEERKKLEESAREGLELVKEAMPGMDADELFRRMGDVEDFIQQNASKIQTLQDEVFYVKSSCRAWQKVYQLLETEYKGR